MLKSANRFAPPASVSGVSLRDVRAQRKADKEVAELLRAETPHADAKAFALGLASGTAFSYFGNAPSLVRELDRTQRGIVQRAHLANWLQEQGMDEGTARHSAAGLQQFLSRPGPTPQAEELAKKFMAKGFRIEGGPHTYNTRAEAEELLRRYAQLRGPQEAKRRIFEVSGDVATGPRMADLLPSSAGAQRILDAARESFEAAGKKAPSMNRALGVVAKSHLPYAAFAGLLAGIGGVALTRNQRRELSELRRYAREH